MSQLSPTPRAPSSANPGIFHRRVPGALPRPGFPAAGPSSGPAAFHVAQEHDALACGGECRDELLARGSGADKRNLETALN